MAHLYPCNIPVAENNAIKHTAKSVNTKRPLGSHFNTIPHNTIKHSNYVLARKVSACTDRHTVIK